VAVTAAVFLDKDGTLVENVPYCADPDRIRLGPGALDGLALLRRAGYELVVVSNQSGVARGLFPEAALAPLAAKLKRILLDAGIPLRGFLYCPHHPDAVVERYRLRCACRKPAPGLLLRAAAMYGLELRASWMVGDILDDVEAGQRASCRTVLLDVGGETEWRPGPGRQPHHVAGDLWEAARLIAASPRVPP
jgi:D-glycero-D-manno-heptose 1,7-bisphosphate phosphatase